MLTLKPVRYASRALMSLAFNQAEASLQNMRVEKGSRDVRFKSVESVEIILKNFRSILDLF